MFINNQDNHNIRDIRILNQEEKALAKAFIQGAGLWMVKLPL